MPEEYAVVATITQPGYSGSCKQRCMWPRLPGRLPSVPPTHVRRYRARHDGSHHAGIGEYPACTLIASSGDYPRTHAGTTNLDANCDGTNYTASASTTLIVSPAAVTINLAGTGSFVYDNTDHAASATVSGDVAGYPATTTITYNSISTVPHDVGVYNVVAALDPSATDYTAELRPLG